MLAIALLVASADIKDVWIRSDTHPVYNSRIKPIPMPGQGVVGLAGTDAPLMVRPDFEKDADDMAVSTTVVCRFGIERMNEEITAEALKPMPDAQRIADCQKIRASFQEMSRRYADRVARNPALEPRIKADMEKLRK